ncbi:MAG TPA: GTP 3',8-cyclase MoaA [Feifaniaceae bacterium]|nr:GTP 3',8-cyclase MoaA [Feifaniaceae bacterium]
MKDQWGRDITYLRLSVTERCQLNCAYCRGYRMQAEQRELTAEEFARVVRAMAKLGVKKVRLTGGEPLLRADILAIVSDLRAIKGIEEITLTTNGQLLPGRARALKEAGLTRVNISMDSLDADRYRAITGGGELAPVLIGMQEAIEAGLAPLKVNAVLMRGINDGEIDAFINLAKERPIDVRFIELMPMGKGDVSRRVTGDEIIKTRPWLTAIPPRYAGQPAADYVVQGHQGRVGFISPLSHRFCGFCNRVRVMSDGMLRLCLGVDAEVSLVEALAQKDDAMLADVIREAVYQKPPTHRFDDDGFHSEKDMSRIGG